MKEPWFPEPSPSVRAFVHGHLPDLAALSRAWDEQARDIIEDSPNAPMPDISGLDLSGMEVIRIRMAYRDPEYRDPEYRDPEYRDPEDAT